MAVTYDNRSLLINGNRSFFASVGIHYPRFTPGQWDDLFIKAKNDGYNMVQTYFFHNAHQPKLSTWPWIQEGPSDLRLFLTKAAKAGLFVDLRIGPYVCAEWSWGGYPYDIGQIPGLVSRSSNPQWEAYMTAVVLNVTREYRDLFADRGGPIVLGQVENELHTNDKDYVSYCGKLAEETEVPIAWGMCNGNSADNTINTCNGGDCTKFIEENGQNGRVLIDQPALWTENWMGWFDSWGGAPAGDWPSFEATAQSSSKALGIYKWVARGGSHVNFYNWAGGNHFARNAGSSMVNVYYWKAPIAADNLKQGAEREHMARAYAAIALAAGDILGTAAQLRREKNLTITIAPGRQHVASAYIYVAAAFLENPYMAGTVEFEGTTYTLPAFSSTLVRDGKVLFCTADVQGGGAVHRWTPVAGFAGWKTWVDPVIAASAAALPPPSPPAPLWHGSALGRVVRANVPLEAVNFSEYDSEITVYACELNVADVTAALGGGTDGGATATINITLATANAQAWTAFANGKLIGTGSELGHHGGTATITFPIPSASLQPGAPDRLDGASIPAGAATTLLVLMSTSLGIDNGGGVHNGNTSALFSSSGVKGITSQSPGSVMLGAQDLTVRTWTHIAGSTGEAKAVYAEATAGGVTWSPMAGTTAGPMTWLSATFEAPSAVLATDAAGERNASLNLDVGGLGRGRFYVNGMDLGRYWSKACSGGTMCQRYYPIPFDILKPAPLRNTLTVLDELGVTNISTVGLAVSTDGLPPPCDHPADVGQNVTTTLCGALAAKLNIKAAAGGAVTVSLASSPLLCLAAVAGTFDARAGVGAGMTTHWQTCAGNDAAQRWSFDAGSGEVKPAANAKLCLDIMNQQAGVDAVIDLWSCNNGANQQWTVRGGDTLQSSEGGVCLGYSC